MQVSSRFALSLIFTLSIGASIAWTIACGQDLNFDLITYHYYLGYSAFVPRIEMDFLAAGAYGYQSPLPFMPLYWLDSIGTPPVLIATLHASFHALNLILLYLLTELLVGKVTIVSERAKIILFWLLGAIAPVYWTLVGTSFADLYTSVPVLAGLWLVARVSTGQGLSPMRAIGWIAIGGALIGAAAGARIHNGIYVAGLFCAVAFAGFPDRNFRLYSTIAFLLAASAGWVLCFAPWAYHLYKEFGNPLFPLFNGVFHSPDFPASNLPFLSFTPGNLWDLVTLPFWMATDNPWIYVELPLPDARPALFTISLLASTLLWLFGRGKWLGLASVSEAGTVVAEAEPGQARRVILIFFIASATLWLAISSNGRFGVALFLLAGPVCGVLLCRLLGTRYAVLVIVAVVLWQGLLQEVFFRQYRFNSMPWTAQYFDWNLPVRLTQEPATFVSFGFQPASTLIPRVHRQSAHINLLGYPDVDAGMARIRRIIGLADKPVYGVFDVTRQNMFDSSTIKTYYTNQARLWGLDFTEQPCELVMLKPTAENWAWLNQIAGVQFRYRPPNFLVCNLRPSSPMDHKHALAELEDFKKKLLHFGATCPEYFQKPLGYVHTDKRWNVTSFASSEMSLTFDHEGSFYLQQLRPPHITLRLGRVTRQQIVADEPDCRKWFSRLSELSTLAARSSNNVSPVQ